MSRPRVVITGLGFITPIGNDREEVLASLRAQRHGLAAVDWFPNCPVRLAATIQGFEINPINRLLWRWPARYAFARETVRSLPPHGLYALCALEQALADARLARAGLTDGGTGLFCASAGSPRFLRHHLNETADSAGQRLHPWGVVASIAGTLNFNLAAHYGIRGAVTGFVSACAASTHALGYACDEIRLGRQTRMLVVGAEEPLWESLLPFAGMRALSRQSDPALASRPFDANRDGFVAGGGAVALVVESATAAAARGAPAYAELAGWGQSADGHSIAQSEPEGHGLSAAMQRALADAGVGAGQIDYVNAHATSTPVGDRAEALALRRLLADAPTPVSSIKGLTGHTLSMSGALETAVCALALREGFIPGNAHLRTPDAACAGLNLPVANLDRAPGCILKNSSGFGGSNVCLVLRAPPERPTKNSR
jgi:3-oxoacyl-(acyl-carrier-protein) synthase